MNAFEKLTKIFEDFPGIGPRQARRFAYFLLGRDDMYLAELSSAVKELKKEVTRCKDCLRYFAKQGGTLEKCSICENTERDSSILMIVAKDTDLLTVERAGFFGGYYFVIGGLIPILEKNPERRIRVEDLKKIVGKRANDGLKEIIIALNATNEGENTSMFLSKFLEEDIKKYNLKVTHLGRGLSTGAELEYADKETIKAALENKK